MARQAARRARKHPPTLLGTTSSSSQGSAGGVLRLLGCPQLLQLVKISSATLQTSSRLLCKGGELLARCPAFTTAPVQLMTAAEMLQAVADIRTDAESRLLEIQAQIQDLEAEAEQLEELING